MCVFSLDTTLIDFTDMKCQRGDLSFIFNGDALPSESFVVLDNEQKVYQRIHHEVTVTRLIWMCTFRFSWSLLLKFVMFRSQRWRRKKRWTFSWAVTSTQPLFPLNPSLSHGHRPAGSSERIKRLVLIPLTHDVLSFMWCLMWWWRLAQERVGSFLADFYMVNGLVLESRKRREHLTEEDILRNKAIMESFSKGGNLIEQNFEVSFSRVAVV